MWDYQGHFRTNLEAFAERILSKAGMTSEVRCVLVGVRQREAKERQPVCVEPERGPWAVTLFSGIDERIANLEAADERQGLVYGDEPSNRDKPKWIRATAVRRAILDCLAPSDAERAVTSFAGGAVEVGGYLVVPVLQIISRELESVPRLQKAQHQGYRTAIGFIEEVIAEVLREATQVLTAPEPGRALAAFKRDEMDVLRSAGHSLMGTPAFVANKVAGALFEGCNEVSALRYEGAAGRGRMVLARRAHPAVDVFLEFERPVPLRAANWARKVLQMGSNDLALLSEGTVIYGLGRLTERYDVAEEEAFHVDFTGHYTWELSHGGTVLMRTAYGFPTLPSVRIKEGDVRVLLRRVFGNVAGLDTARIWSSVEAAVEQKHGALLVVSADAPGEAARLAAQATPVKPHTPSPDLIRRVTAIDGAVLLDPAGVCHAIGVILDGQAVADGDPARGARFNSAKRYVAGARAETVALVVSEDGHVNVLPELPPLLRRSEVELHVAALHAIADDVWSDWHRERNWLDEHRFYLSEEQCAQANRDLGKLKAASEEEGLLWWPEKAFAPDPRMNDSFFEPED